MSSENADRTTFNQPPKPSFSSNWMRRSFGGWLLMIILMGVISFYVVYPLFLILLNSFNVAPIGAPEIYGLQAWRDAFGDPEISASLWNSITVATVLLLISFPLAILLAWLLGRTNIPFARGFEFFFWISFLMPNLATTFGWIALLDPTSGLINKGLAEFPLLGEARFNIYSFWGIIWAHLMANGLSTKVMLLTPAFRRMDASFEEASRIAGHNTFMTMLKVMLPVMTPILVVVFLLALIRMFATFEIELLLGTPWGFYVFSTMIVDLARQMPPLLNQSAALGSVTLLFLAVFILLQRWLIMRRQFTTVTGQFRPKLVDLGAWKIPAVVLVSIVLALLVVVPVLSTVGSSFMVHFGSFDLPNTWTLDYWKGAFDNPDLMLALKNTLIIATSAAVLGPLLFSFIAYVLVRTRLPGRSALDAICWIPSAIPGVLSGLGILWLVLGTEAFRPLYGTLFLLILVTILGGMTLSTQILKANFIQMGKDLEEAARVSGAGFFRTYFKVVLPIMAQTMIMVAVIKFMFAAEHTSSIILLATSQTMTLSLLTLEQIAYGYYEPASVTILLVVGLTVGCGLIARTFGLRIGMPDGRSEK